MAWTIRISRAAEGDLARLDPSVARRIIHYLNDRVARSDNPRLLAQPLSGSRFKGYWRFRVGDYRVITTIEDREITIIVVSVGHRSDIYR